MCIRLLRKASVFAELLKIDERLAEEAQERGCPHCGGVLHRASYERKPRGVPAKLGGRLNVRFSFCCSSDGCRRRVTPPSVRFLGRRVYLGAVVVVLSALHNGVTVSRLTRLRRYISSVSRRTLLRWRDWWLSSFVTSPLWLAVRPLLMPPVDEHRLPASLLERFGGNDRNRLVSCLRFLCPFSTTSSPVWETSRSPAC